MIVIRAGCDIIYVSDKGLLRFIKNIENVWRMLIYIVLDLYFSRIFIIICNAFD